MATQVALYEKMSFSALNDSFSYKAISTTLARTMSLVIIYLIYLYPQSLACLVIYSNEHLLNVILCQRSERMLLKLCLIALCHMFCFYGSNSLIFMATKSSLKLRLKRVQ